MQLQEQSVRECGTVVKFIRERGFGFIERVGCVDLWFHVTELEPGDAERIQPGARVEFSISTDRRDRQQAASVELL